MSRTPPPAISTVRFRTRSSNRHRRHWGSSMVESLLALPVVLLLGLGVAQFTLVYQAKHALDHALTQAARQGAVDHAAGASMRAGLASGLVPYLYGAADWTELLRAEARAAEHVDEGLAAGWISLVQRSPTQESFDDWAEPALDETGEPIAGMVEIANDNLDNRRLRTQPMSGVAGLHLSEPIGRLSGQTLADANLLRLELVYGVRLVVPVVAPLIIRMLSVWNGCRSAEAVDTQEALAPEARASPGGGESLGLLVLGSGQAIAGNHPWMCAFYAARDGDGRPDARIPIRAAATVRMMSTARHSDFTRGRSSSTGETPSGAGGAGTVDGQVRARTPEVRHDGGSEASRDRDRDSVTPTAGSDVIPTSSLPGLTNGFLGIGSDRPYRIPQAHPALCPA